MKIQSINPATGEIIEEIECSTKEEVLSVIKRAKVAQKDWFAKPKDERIKIIKNLKIVLKSNKDELQKLIHEEAGYPPSVSEDVFYDILDGIDYYSERYQKLNNMDFPLNSEVQPDTTAEVQFVPHGVIGHIGIWNYPFWQTMITAIPALLTGNAVVYKPSEYVTMVGLKIAALIHESGVPKDVYVPVIGGVDIGKIIVNSDVDAIVFTGGIDTGEYILKNAGTKPLILELSGNDPAIICKDCDIEQTVRGLTYGTFLHSGQVCIRIKKVYIVKEIADEFIKKFVEYSKKLKIRKSITPLIREGARQKVHKVVQDAVSNGAKLLLGGNLPEGKGYFYPPTILQIEDDNLEVIKKETFGPVCSIRVVENEEEAIKLANDSIYGLGASVWTQDYRKARKIAERLEVGTVWVNDSNMPLICGEYIQGWKSSSISSSQERLMMFLKKRNIISFNSKEKRKWWF